MELTPAAIWVIILMVLRDLPHYTESKRTNRNLLEYRMQQTPISESTAWWLELATNEPYLYLFGPFDSKVEAESSVEKHRADLTGEGWQVTSAKLTDNGPASHIRVA